MAAISIHLYCKKIGITFAKVSLLLPALSSFDEGDVYFIMTCKTPIFISGFWRISLYQRVIYLSKWIFQAENFIYEKNFRLFLPYYTEYWKMSLFSPWSALMNRTPDFFQRSTPANSCYYSEFELILFTELEIYLRLFYIIRKF